MIIDNFLKKDIVKLCSYPKKAPGWIDGVYYPRVMNMSEIIAVDEKDGCAHFHVKAWKEIVVSMAVKVYRKLSEHSCIAFK